MRVSFFNTFLEGGAASAALGLYEMLPNEELDTIFYYSRDLSKDPGKLALVKNYKRADPRTAPQNFLQKKLSSLKARMYYQKLMRFEKNRPSGFEQFSFSKQYFNTPFHFFGPLPDVIHLHWIAEWIDFSSFFDSIPDELPIVWTLHDMNAFTGGCHYSWDCMQYLSACMACPQLGPYKDGSLVKESWQAKLNALKKKNIHIVADSYWIEQEAKKSGLLKNAKSFQTIHYGVNTQIFFPKRNKSDDIFTIAFGAASFENKRKGFSVLQNALKIVYKEHKKVRCIVFGKGELISTEAMPPFTVMGKIDQPEKLAEIYNQADVFVIPSLYEAFGQTSLEAMACGVPVIGFDTGGIPDTVKHEQTGLLAQPGSEIDLADKILYLMNHETIRTNLGNNATEFIRKNFTLKMQVDKYRALYHSLK